MTISIKVLGSLLFGACAAATALKLHAYVAISFPLARDMHELASNDGLALTPNHSDTTLCPTAEISFPAGSSLNYVMTKIKLPERPEYSSEHYDMVTIILEYRSSSGSLFRNDQPQGDLSDDTIYMNISSDVYVIRTQQRWTSNLIVGAPILRNRAAGTRDARCHGSVRCVIDDPSVTDSCEAAVGMFTVDC